ncbi:MAG: DUF2478 domain-containing protein [Fimbriimonadaceae bacterium]|nr:DUF2478 domain-containing protein [Fimbriimonadaceae bacterium]
MQASRTPTQGIWRRAAVLGSVWGAAEVMLGSFLHNLQIPLRGYVLTFLAVALLVAAHRVWPVRGLFWRAGLICAAMKTLSPSPAIFGPMLAIAMEAALLEVGFAAGLRRWPGYLVGGALAMAWPLAQKALNLLIVFGGDLVDLYSALVGFAAKNLGPIGFWTPILALLSVTTTAGVVAAGLGMRVGEDARREHEVLRPVPSRIGPGEPRPEFVFPYSRAWLTTVLVALIVVLAVVEAAPLPWAAGAVGAFLAILVGRYGRFVKRLFSRPGLWLTFAAVTVLAAWAMGSRTGRFTMEGLLHGVEMLLRAVTVLVGFSGLSTELRDPALGKRVRRAWAREFLFACGLAFRALPLAIERLPALDAWRHPRFALATMVGGLDAFLAEATPRVVVVTGERGSGKTTLLARLAKDSRDKGEPLSGILSPGRWEGGTRTGYEVESVSTGVRETLAVSGAEGGVVRQGPFAFMERGFALGRSALREAFEAGAKVVIVDEVGPLELRGEGWVAELDRLLGLGGATVVLAVRPSLVDEVSRRWSFAPMGVVDASDPGAYEALVRVVAVAESR